jgi:hypothetical protein
MEQLCDIDTFDSSTEVCAIFPQPLKCQFRISKRLLDIFLQLMILQYLMLHGYCCETDWIRDLRIVLDGGRREGEVLGIVSGVGIVELVAYLKTA